MGVYLDHTIVEVKDVQETMAFYRDILGFRHRPDLSEFFTVIQINETLGFDFLTADSVDSRHFAFCMDKETFESIFVKLKTSGISYGDRYDRPDNMTGPGQASGTRGIAEAIYFHDPNGHLLEIRHYPGD